MMKTIKRKKQDSIIDALTNAQKFIFAPIAFQALASLLDFGIIEFLDKNPGTEEDIISALDLDEYTVRTLLQIGIANKIIYEQDNNFNLTKMGRLFLYDEMTKTNFNYVKDVCYLGASELTSSFKEQKPQGLQKFIGNYPTIYSALTNLPDKMRQSWYEFDHLYSDNCFEEVFRIISKNYKSIYDIGGNTGKFEKLCFKYDKNFDITMFDLKSNIDKIRDDAELSNCKFHPINVLDKSPNYPEIRDGAVLMSQFLDCFSKKDIVKILTDVRSYMDKNSALYILEPYTDRQKFEGAKYSLTHTSLYFTCMANGVSKFYTLKEMEELIEKSGFTINRRYDDIGSYNYTLLECKNSTMGRWFQIKEQSAGKNRLRLSWFLYKIFGKNVLYLIALIVGFFTFLFAPKVREYSRKFFKVIEPYSGLKPGLVNQFKHIHSYAESLVDKLLVYSGDFEPDNLVFENEDMRHQLFEDIDRKNGVFFICNHVGNIEVLQSFFLNKETKPDFNINVFMSNQQSRIFNSFLSTIKREYPIKAFRVEDIGVNTSVELKDNLNKGDIAFIAGDRLAQDNEKKNIEAELFAHNIFLPKGAFRLAKLMDVPTYFISAIKTDGKYRILLEKQSGLSEQELTDSYVKFLERTIKTNPYQFFHFYDFFE